MRVRDHQLHAAQPTSGELAQEVGAEGLGFRGPDRHAEHFTPAVGVDADGDDHRHGNDPADLADLHVGGVDSPGPHAARCMGWPKIRPVAFERTVEERADPLVDLLAQPGDPSPACWPACLRQSDRRTCWPPMASSRSRPCHRGPGGLRSDPWKGQGQQALEGVLTSSSTDRVDTPWIWASRMTAVSAFSASRRGSRKPGKYEPMIRQEPDHPFAEGTTARRPSRAQLREAQLDRPGARLPDPVAVAVALRQPLGTPLAPRRTGLAANVQLPRRAAAPPRPTAKQPGPAGPGGSRSAAKPSISRKRSASDVFSRRP